jgi:hypothetical protein
VKRLVSLIAFFLLIAPVAALCQGGLKTLDGAWGVDVPATIALLANVPGDVPADPVDRKMLEAFLRSISIEFNTAAKRMTVRMGGETKTESFTVESDSAALVTLRKGQTSIPYEIHGADKIVGGAGKGESKRLVLRRLR